MTIPGIGPVTASAITATIQDMSAFASGREFSAFLGLTPRQSSSGGKERLGRITKMGDRYLRKLLVVGACATLRHRQGHNDALRRWASGLLERKTVKYKFKLTAVALANKVARIVFVLMTGAVNTTTGRSRPERKRLFKEEVSPQGDQHRGRRRGDVNQRTRLGSPLHCLRSQRAGQLELGFQRHRGDRDRVRLRPVPGAETVHGGRRHGAVMTVIYLEQACHHPGYYTLAIMLALLSLGLGIAYTPWMASYTETVEARNPALIATGLAIWGWIIRIVVFVAYLLLPVVVNSVTPLVNYGATVQAYSTQYASQIAFAQSHPTVVAAAQKVPPAVVATATSIPANVTATAAKIPPSVLATAQANATQLANAQKFAPELAVIQAHPALFAKLATYKNPATIPPTLVAQAVAAAGGGAKGLKILTTIGANQAAIAGVIAAAPALKTVAPYAADLRPSRRTRPS